MSVRLRAHHLLCMLTYVGKGYSPAFTANYDRVAGRLLRGEVIELVEGPDEICAPLLAEEDAPHCHKDSVKIRDNQARQGLARLLHRDLSPGETIRLDAGQLARLRAAFADSSVRNACVGCSWQELCDKVSGGGFQGAALSSKARRPS